MKKNTKAPKTTKKAAPAAAPANIDVTPAVLTPTVVTKLAVPAPVAATAAPAKVAPAPVKSAAPTATTPVTIVAKVDVGFGNNLFVRGQGGGLSWERGLPLENVDSKTWRLNVPAQDQVQFKLLLNDAVWCKGEDLVAAPGKKVEVTPSF